MSLGRGVGLRPVAGIGYRRPKRYLVLFGLRAHRDDIGLRLRQHWVELPDIVGLRGDVGGEDDLAGVTTIWAL